jgi:hypothetical protein
MNHGRSVLNPSAATSVQFKVPLKDKLMVKQTLSGLPEIVPQPPATRMLAASSAAGAHSITRATYKGGQIEPVGRPFA